MTPAATTPSATSLPSDQAAGNRNRPSGVHGSHRSLFLVLLFAGLVRAVALAAQFSQLDADPDGYRQLAVQLAEQGVLGPNGVPSAYRPPLYPLLLVPLTALANVSVGVAVLHWCCGLMTVAGCHWLAQRWISPRLAWLPAVLIACDPILLRQSALVMTETVATLLTVVALMALTEFGQQPVLRRALVAGGCLGLATLCRPTFLPWCALAPLAWWLLPGSNSEGDGATTLPGWPRRTWLTVSMMVATAAVLSPWVIRNQLVMGRMIATTTHGGYTLYLGNNPEFYQHLNQRRPGGSWQADLFDQRVRERRLADRAGRPAVPSDELHADQQEYQAAWEAIRLQPFGFTDASQFRLQSFWGLRPHQGGKAAWLIGVWYGLEFLLAAWGAFYLGRRLGRTPWSWGVLLVLLFTAVHAVYWSNLRMRAPLMPVVVLAAGAGVAAIGKADRRTQN